MESSTPMKAKPRRTLSDAQKENLRKGRERLQSMRKGEEYRERVKKRRAEHVGGRRRKGKGKVTQEGIHKAAKAISAHGQAGTVSAPGATLSSLASTTPAAAMAAPGMAPQY